MTFERWWQENKRRARESRLKDAVCEAWHDGYRAGWRAAQPKIQQQEKENARLLEQYTADVTAALYRQHYGEARLRRLMDALTEIQTVSREVLDEMDTMTALSDKTDRLRAARLENERLRAAVKSLLTLIDEGDYYNDAVTNAAREALEKVEA